MEVYLTIMVTVLVATQIIRVTQNHISIIRQQEKIDETCSWLNENDISEKDFEIQRKVFYLLYKKLTEDKQMKIIEVNPAIKDLVDANNGYCPCTVVKNDDTKCICREFKEQKSGLCHCGRFEKVVE